MPPHHAAADRYATMPFRRCGQSGLVLPPVSLGFWQNGSDPAAVRQLLCPAFNQGLIHVDLANNYGDPAGAAETAVGTVLRQDLAAYRDELLISTKAGYDMWPGPFGDGGSRKYLLASIEQSLGRLQLDHVDIFYHHRPDPTVPLAETIGALADIVASGKAVWAGISNYDAELARRAVGLAAEAGCPLVVNQVQYNLLHRYPEAGVLAQASAAGLGVVAYSPLAQGLLTDRYLDGVPADSRAGRDVAGLAGRLDDEVLATIKELHQLARDRGQSLAEMALTWLLQQEAVTSVVVGASRLSQLHANLRACHASPLTAAECQRIDALTRPPQPAPTT